MKDSFISLGYADLIDRTDNYLKKNFLLITIFGITAGVGRYNQEVGIGELSATTHALLEIIVNLARVLIILVVIGQGHLQAGFNNVINVFRLSTADWQEVWTNVKGNFSSNFLAILVNLILFIVIAVIINITLFALFEYTAFLTWLKSAAFINHAASKWPVVLFLKNISIIPFTLVFETLFVLWIVKRNKLVNP